MADEGGRMGGTSPSMVGAWLHSREEDTESVTVYRPADHSFRPSRRSRHGLEFRADGTFVELRPGPDDRPRRLTGRWRGTAAGAVRVVFSAESSGSPESAPRVFRVLSCAEDKLTIAK